MEDLNKLLNQFGDFFVGNWFRIVAALIVLIIGGILITLLTKLLMKIIYGTKIDNAAGGFVVALLRVVLWIALIFGCVSILGLDSNSFLVAFSSVALAIGLALKDSLSNIANGMVILAEKPFRKGDHVAIGSVEGIIKRITILTTELTTFDNKKVILPNNTVASDNITNFTANPTRRIDFTFGVAYGSDIDKVQSILEELIENYSLALKMPKPSVFLETQSASSLDFKVRFWVNTVDYWTVYGQMQAMVYKAFVSNNIEIPFNQLDIHLDTKGNTEPVVTTKKGK
jgi:small conductance mechanosensitive channel